MDEKREVCGGKGRCHHRGIVSTNHRIKRIVDTMTENRVKEYISMLSTKVCSLETILK